MTKVTSVIHIEVFHGPCCGGSAGQAAEIRLAHLMRDIPQQLGQRVEITIHTLAFGDPVSLEAVSTLTEYLRTSGLRQIVDAGIFAILGALPIISLSGMVRFVQTVPDEKELLAAIENVPAVPGGRDESGH